MKKKFGWSLEQRKAWYGVLFASPLLFGMILLFILPLIQSFRYSLSDINLVPEGFQIDYRGFGHYTDLFVKNPEFNRKLADSVIDMVVNVPIIIIFSLFAAVLLNQKFAGRALARAIFFLPVILAASAVANLDISSFVGSSVLGTSDGGTDGSSSLLQSFELKKMMIDSGLAPFLVQYITGAVDRIYEIISSSGVQILIFLAGLQSISPSLYEASKLEGATGYEIFWKVTFPMVTPLILTNTVYSIIDSFNTNKLNQLISQTAFQTFNFGASAAMAWIYFAVVAIVLGISVGLISRKVFYYV
ncbi:sugar ABC transporter permease [Paenibacillus aurantius]|uniref:Sugar ABC transporter permease n=1 Tax=Paenibacillus aurantius TaxID=2918900 RepID=A0AA96LFP8_9BACL|nr:sugar ABC transporter permease [Paenibacillus aurantius]WNQ13072.1 sugar ABC transporter permease [Paenibacillus aurantius]